MTLYVDITYDDGTKKPKDGAGVNGDVSPSRDEVADTFKKPSGPTDTEAEFTEFYETQTVGGQELESLQNQMDDDSELKIQEQADAVYKSVGQTGAAPGVETYDYQGLVRDGQSIEPGDDGSYTLPNKNIRPNTVELEGYDLSNGHKVRSVPRKEPVTPEVDTVVESAVREIAQSATNTAKGAPMEDTAPLSRIAYGHIKGGGSWDEFKAQLPNRFDEEQIRMAYRVADDYHQKEQLVNTLNNLPLQPTVPGIDNAPMPPESWDLSDQDLQDNDIWMNSARVIHRNMEGEEFSGSDEELNAYMRKTMSGFNFNTWDMASLVQASINGADDMKRALYYAMTLYDQKSTTTDDVLNGLASVGTDPTNLIGLGFGAAAVKGAQTVFKKELSTWLAKYLGVLAAGAGEGAVYTGYDDAMRQFTELEAGAKDEYDTWQTTKAAGVGSAAGMVLGPAMLYGGENLIAGGKKLINNAKTVDWRGPVSGGPASMAGRIGVAPEKPVSGVSSMGVLDEEPGTVFTPDPNDVRTPNKQVGRMLHDRSRAALGDQDLTANTPENKDFIANVLTQEVLQQLRKDKSAGNAPASQWYRTTLDNMRLEVGKIYPGVVSDHKHRTAFDFALAITSNGQKVSDNSRYALEVYEYWRQHGRMPEGKRVPTVEARAREAARERAMGLKPERAKKNEQWGWGKEASAMRNSFELYNDLLDAYGDDLNQVLATEVSVRRMKDMGFDVSDEAADAKLPLSVIFGSKIGGGFYSNLQGDFNRLTPDRWFSRTWGRVTGTLMKENPKLAQEHYGSFRDNYVANKKLITQYLGHAPNKSDLTDEVIDEIGQQIFAKWSRMKNPSFPDKSNPIHKLSRAIDSRLKPKEAPAGTKERKMMRETMALVQEKLSAIGLDDLQISDLQAILWYPEQRLWDQMGSTQTGKENDYERAFGELIGFDARSAGQRRPAGSVQAGAETGLEAGSAAQFTKTEALRRLWGGPRGRNSSEPSGRQFTVSKKDSGDANLGGSKTHKPSRQLFDRLGITAEPWVEMSPGASSAADFTKAITAAKASRGEGGASVYVYPQEDLVNAKLFLTADKKAGFALKVDPDDGLVDIVSVFTHKNVGRKGSAYSALKLAVEQGGEKLDAFDVGLPSLYAKMGFQETGRVPWADEYKPSDWNTAAFNEYNRGKPDVVFMKFNPNSNGRYTRGDTNAN